MRLQPLSLLITALWLFMMALLARDFLLPRNIGREAKAVTTGQLTDNWRDIHQMLLIRRGDQVLGASVLSVVKERGEEGYHASQRLRLTFGTGGMSATVNLEGVAALSADFELDRFWVHLAATGIDLAARGQVAGSNLLFEVKGPLGARLYTQPLGHSVSLLDALRPTLFENIRLEPGASYRIPGADLFGSFAISDLVVEIEDYDLVETSQGRVPAYRILTQFGGQTTTSWVDESGQLVLQPLWGDIVLERAAPRTLDVDFRDLLADVSLPAFDLTNEAGAQPWSPSLQGLFSLRRLAWGETGE
jgi:hypothetical protein